MADLFGVYVPRLDGLRDGTITPSWIPDLVAVREVIQFAEATDLITIAARPGDGKSSFLRYEMLKYAINGGRPLIFNLENDEMDYAMHFLSLFVNMDGLPIIENTKLKNPRLLSEDELRRVKEAARMLSRLPVTIVTIGSPTVSQVIQIARRKIAEKHCDLIGLDYVQLIRNGNKENRNDDIGETTGALRGLNLDMHIPILMNAQLNREIERRGKDDAGPQLSDLRDSGSIEQDSTHVIFPRSLWKDPSIEQMRIFPENMDERNRPLPRLKAIPMVFYVRKNRNGPTGPSTPVKWTKTTGDFSTMEGELRI
jgi:replicative DNA helicase